MSLTVACVFVHGHVPFSWLYVECLRAMVRAYLGRPHRFVCLTDQPWKAPRDIDTIPIPAPGTMKGWWSKLHLFDERHDLGDRVLYLDLDTLVVAPLEPLVDYPAAFALVSHAGTFTPKDGKAVVRRYNSSVMVWDAGVPSPLFAAWTPAAAERLWGDQDWIGERCPTASTMPIEWFPRLSDIIAGKATPAARVVLCKKPKNEEAAKLYPWFAERWGALPSMVS